MRRLMAAATGADVGRRMQTIANAEAVLIRVDLWLVHLINGCSGYWVLDWSATFADRNTLAKGGLIIAAYWGMWFVSESRQSTREKIIFALAGALASIVVARALASAFPFRLRPLYRTDIGYLSPHLPSFAHPVEFEGWSSFPSDHAALFFALAIGLWRCSRMVGSIALVFVTLWICLVRVYLGIHFPSDIVAGAAIGIGCAFISGRMANRRITAQVLRIEQQYPSWFYPAMFLITYEFAALFEDVRELMHGTMAALHAIGFQSVGLIGALAVAAGLLAILLGAVGFALYRRGSTPRAG
jgi:undecaprenyl-diphosphatase